MTYNEICLLLSRAGISEPQREAELLLEHFCSVGAASVLADRERDYECEELSAAIGRRAGRYPLQYILGEWNLRNESYAVGPGVLIPRPDTELLVEAAARLAARGGRFLDVGTGSGCVSVSLLAARQDLSGLAADISSDALEIAALNAGRNGVAARLDFVRGDMTDAGFWRSVGKFDAVISNPPYIPTGELAGLEPELAYEPRAALDGGRDGLDFYRKILENAHYALKPDGVILLEAGFGQAESIGTLAASAGYRYEVLCDIESRPRTVVISHPTEREK